MGRRGRRRTLDELCGDTYQMRKFNNRFAFLVPKYEILLKDSVADIFALHLQTSFGKTFEKVCYQRPVPDHRLYSTPFSYSFNFKEYFRMICQNQLEEWHNMKNKCVWSNSRYQRNRLLRMFCRSLSLTHKNEKVSAAESQC